MASSLEFVQFACDQLFIKVTEAGKEFAPETPLAPPYEGAKPYFLIEDLEGRDFLAEFSRRTLEILPPKEKKMRRKK